MARPSSERVRAVSGQTAQQVPQPMQRLAIQCSWGRAEMLSGLWHQAQHSGQPFRNTVLQNAILRYGGV